MILRLYKNTQTESDNNDIYSNLWRFNPYSPSSMFCEGFTSEEDDFIVPDEYELTELNGRGVLRKGTAFFDLVNTADGYPALKIVGGSCVSLVLYKKGEAPPAPVIPASKRKTVLRDEDYYNEDGSLNIW